VRESGTIQEASFGDEHNGSWIDGPHRILNDSYRRENLAKPETNKLPTVGVATVVMPTLILFLAFVNKKMNVEENFHFEAGIPERYRGR
jgi:hypothetical protein